MPSYELHLFIKTDNYKMKKRLALFVICFICFGRSFAQERVPAYSAEDLARRVAGKDTTYIVNFWATWCLPCIGELPQFAKLYDYYQGKPVKIIMVSCNLKEEYPDKLQEYIAEKNIRQEVVWLNDTDIIHYRPVIDDQWSGQIPSTIIFDNRKGEKHIIEEVTTAEAIKKIID